ncbi:hypothetical protein [Streptomyces sp. NPDC047065]|uniref:hypothetical protein n=1 Tax=Streptomyces sp. NPDC047065 TaxID=3154606 RepID=UPI00340A8707
MTMPTPESQPSRTFVPGPPVSPSGPLLAWLNDAADTNPRRLVRLPVVVRFDPKRLGIVAGAVGTGPGGDGDRDAIRLTLNDRAMGVPLADRVRAHCPTGEDACAVWLDGYWGLPDGAFSQEGQPDPEGGVRAVFSPVSVGDSVAAGQRPEDVRAFVEQ